MERTSPTRFGIEVPRLKSDHQSIERGSHGEDYYCRSGFGKAGDGGAWSRRGGSDDIAQGTAAGSAAQLVGQLAALRDGDGGLRRRALLGARADAAGAHGTDHRGGVRAGLSQEREERRQRRRGDLHGGAAAEHAVRGDEVGGTAGGVVRASLAPGLGRGTHGADQSVARLVDRVRGGGAAVAGEAAAGTGPVPGPGGSRACR